MKLRLKNQIFYWLVRHGTGKHILAQKQSPKLLNVLLYADANMYWDRSRVVGEDVEKHFVSSYCQAANMM